MTFDPAPIPLATVVDPAWLSAAMSQGGSEVQIARADVIEMFGPSATKIRLKLEFASPPPADTPTGLCIKGFFDDPNSRYLQSGMQMVEASFYRDCASTLPVRVPRCVYAGTDEQTQAGVIVMEDLTTRGVHFLTALSAYSPEQTKGSLGQMALLHASTWAGRDAGRFPLVTSKLKFLHDQQIVPPARVTELLRGERGEDLPDSVRDGDRVYAALAVLADRSPSHDCFIHGDAHAGNVYEGPEGIGLIDWQLLQKGHWSLDVAYHIAAVLDVEDRRRMEQDLLRHYLDALAAQGIEAPGWDDAWLSYRQSVAYGLFLWGITQRVLPPIIRQFTTRLGTAVVDHDSYALLDV